PTSVLPKLEEERDAHMRTEVVGRLRLAKQIDVEDLIADVGVNREPIQRHQANAETHVQREPVVAGELRLPYSADQIRRHVPRALLTEETLAWQDGVSHLHVIVRVLALG